MRRKSFGVIAHETAGEIDLILSSSRRREARRCASSNDIAEIVSARLGLHGRPEGLHYSCIC